ncbi:MAG: drug/metabolite exporter YedA [Anaerolineae bacterium]|nr:drug/metabolite exporter YedA [Anaerolineae bacterium]
MRTNKRTLVIVALLTVYIIWGTTYLAIRYALESFPPYLMMGIRFVIAGGGLFAFLWLRGATMPTLRQWRSAAIVGILLYVGAMGSVAMAEQSVSSGLAATLVATSPVFAMLFSLLWGGRPVRREWIGVALGILGVALLTFEGDLRANPGGIALMVFAPLCWSLGSVWSKHLDLPKGAMGNAAEMLVGGVVLVPLGLLRGEQIASTPTPAALLALVYLITFGSLATMTAYMFLLKTVSPALATSYAFVNPAIALALGVLLGGERITGMALVALPIILIGVGFVALRKQNGLQAVRPASSEAA